MHYLTKWMVESREDYLRLVKESVKVVYLVACSISKMLENCSDNIRLHGTVEGAMK